jgi:hypothetical protein
MITRAATRSGCGWARRTASSAGSAAISVSTHSTISSIRSAPCLEELTASFRRATIPWKTSWFGGPPAPLPLTTGVGWPFDFAIARASSSCRRQVTWATHSVPQTCSEVKSSSSGAADQ